MRLKFEIWQTLGLRLAWPRLARTAGRPGVAMKAPKILTGEELRHLFSSELSQGAQVQHRQRPMGMIEAARRPA